MSLLLLNPAVTSSFREHRNLYHTHCHPCRTLRRLRAFGSVEEYSSVEAKGLARQEVGLLVDDV